MALLTPGTTGSLPLAGSALSHCSAVARSIQSDFEARADLASLGVCGASAANSALSITATGGAWPGGAIAHTLFECIHRDMFGVTAAGSDQIPEPIS